MPSNSKEYMKKYYTEKKPHILERMKEPLKCDICNTTITRSNMVKHIKSKKHIKLMETDVKKNMTLQTLTDQIEELKNMIKQINVSSVQSS